jgi:UTP--glucose-1-phosphate uridylyltransferase
MPTIQKLIVVLNPRRESFLPLGSINSSALWLMGDQPLMQYLVDEAKASGLKEIIFVGTNRDKEVYSYFTVKPTKESGYLGQAISGLRTRNKDITFQFIGANKNLSSGEIILKLKSKLKAPWAMAQLHGILRAQRPSFQQLEKIFNTSQKPVLGLVEAGADDRWEITSEKIAQRILKISKIDRAKKKEKKNFLSLSGYALLTPEIIDFLEELKKQGVKNENLELEKGLSLMLDSGQPLYGYQLKGEWLRTDSKEDWLKANLQMILNHPSLGLPLRDYLKNQHLC